MRSPAKYSCSCVDASFRMGDSSSCRPRPEIVREPEPDQHVAVALQDDLAYRGVHRHGGVVVMRHVLSWGVAVWRRRASPTGGPWRNCARAASARYARADAPGRRGGRARRPPRRMPRSVGMKASGSRSARMATYSAVQGPMPGSATRERRNSTGSAPGSMTTSPVSTASGQCHEGTAPARRHGEGTRVALGQLDERGRCREEVGHRADRCGRGARRPRAPAVPATVRAPGTETCCPMTARTASSNPSAAPGTRRPGSRRTNGADERVVPQGLPNGDGIGIEVEQLAAPGHGRVQVAQVRQDELALHVGRALGARCVRGAQR